MDINFSVRISLVSFILEYWNTEKRKRKPKLLLAKMCELNPSVSYVYNKVSKLT